METKICNKCGEDKALDAFTYDNGYYRRSCKQCCRLMQNIVQKKWKENNRQRCREHDKAFRVRHANKIALYEQARRITQHAERRSAAKKYRDINPDKVKVSKNASMARSRKYLTGPYVKHALHHQFKGTLSKKDMTPELIELKKAQLSLIRTAREAKNESNRTCAAAK